MQAMRTQMTKLQQETDRRIEALLTEEQIAKYKELQVKQ